MTTKTMERIQKGLGIAIIVIGVLLIAFTIIVSASGCGSQADVAAENVSKDAENFKVMRRVVFFNGITDKYLLEIIGKSSIETDGRKMFVIVKVGPDTFKKHYLGLSDNVSYFVEQLEPVQESVYFYKVNFRPTTIIPNININ